MRQGRVACAPSSSRWPWRQKGGGAATDPFSGTWEVAAAPRTPWASGGTLTISAATASAVPGATGQAAWDAYVRGYCTGPAQPGGTAPKVSAWYSVQYSWSGGGTMGGCVSDKTNGQLIFFGAGSMGHITGASGDTLSGDWRNNPSGEIKFTAKRAADKASGPSVRISNQPQGRGPAERRGLAACGRLRHAEGRRQDPHRLQGGRDAHVPGRIDPRGEADVALADPVGRGRFGQDDRAGVASARRGVGVGQSLARLGR